MHAKGFPRFFVLVMIIASAGCDNVEFGGFRLELQAPAPAQAMPSEVELPDSLPPPLAPIETGPVLYVVERAEGSDATLIGVATISEDGYEPLPTPEDEPDLAERFAIGRFDAGTELVLLSRGGRSGTFITDGTSGLDVSTCRSRPQAGGRVELRPEVASERYFLAVDKDDLFWGDLAGREGPAALVQALARGALDAGSVTAAQITMQEMNVPWPPSIPTARQDLQPLAFDGGATSGFAATFLYGGDLEIGPEATVAYSLFVAAAPGENPERFEPIVAWYQRYRAGKAFPRLLGAHDVREAGTPDLVFEVFGQEDRWLGLMGARDGEWSMLYEDPCGEPADRGGIRTFR